MATTQTVEFTDEAAAKPTEGPWTTGEDVGPEHAASIFAHGNLTKIADCEFPNDQAVCIANAKMMASAWTMAAEIKRLRASNAEMLAALKAAVSMAELARLEWDRAPNGMRAGKLLIALAGDMPGYRPETDAIHAAIASAEARADGG